jgi:tocopherol O-methyltransferase
VITPSRPADARRVAGHYDALDPFYRALWGEHLHHGLFVTGSEAPEEAVLRMVDRVAEAAALSPGEEVCDVGCGYGATALELARRHGVRVTGLTLSEAQLRRARARTPSGLPVRFLRRDWLDNGLPDEAFHAVLAVECLAHMQDKPRFFREVARTLRPGGRVVVCAWMAGPRNGPLARRLLLEPICQEGALPGLGTEAEYRVMMADAGLELAEFQDLTRAVRRTWTVAGRRMVGAFLRDPGMRRALFDPSLEHRSFALAVLRIRWAYRVGAMRYGLFRGRRPARARP